MKDFLEKYKKILIIVLIILLFLGLLAGVYFFFLKDSDLLHFGDGNNVVTEENVSSDEETATEVTPLKDYDVRSSNEAIIATSTEAIKWASDAKLYDCTGLTLSSAEYTDITYYFVGAQEGMYAEWICTYYSETKNATRIYSYDEGEIEAAEAMDEGEYGYMMYDGIDYPTELESIVDSSNLYSQAVEEGLDSEANYVNMYLGDTMDYGYVWRVEERSQTENDEYDIGLLVNTYVFDLSGNLEEVTQEEVY